MTIHKKMPLFSLNGTNIAATSMTLSTIDCDEPCNPTVTVIWTNTGKREKFRPAITVNGNKIELGTEITLDKNHSTMPVEFNLTNLMEGTYEICPYPNATEEHD